MGVGNQVYGIAASQEASTPRCVVDARETWVSYSFSPPLTSFDSSFLLSDLIDDIVCLGKIGVSMEKCSGKGDCDGVVE